MSHKHKWYKLHIYFFFKKIKAWNFMSFCSTCISQMAPNLHSLVSQGFVTLFALFDSRVTPFFRILLRFTRNWPASWQFLQKQCKIDISYFFLNLRASTDIKNMEWENLQRTKLVPCVVGYNFYIQSFS